MQASVHTINLEIDGTVVQVVVPHLWNTLTKYEQLRCIAMYRNRCQLHKMGLDDTFDARFLVKTTQSKS